MGRLHKKCAKVVISWLVAGPRGTDSMRASKALEFTERYLRSSRLVTRSKNSK